MIVDKEKRLDQERSSELAAMFDDFMRDNYTFFSECKSCVYGSSECVADRQDCPALRRLTINILNLGDKA